MNFLHHRLSSLPCQSSGRGEKAAKGMGRVLTKHKLFFSSPGGCVRRLPSHRHLGIYVCPSSISVPTSAAGLFG